MDIEDPSVLQHPISNMDASDVEACRICLATDVKMYSLQGTHLGHCMDAITGLNLSIKGLPNYVCYQCTPSLIKCYKLIEKNRSAQTILEDISKKNGQITKALIEEQNKSQLDLQSTLDSYLLINYFYIKYDDDNHTSEFIKTKLDPNVKINIKLKNEIKEQSPADETELLINHIELNTFEVEESKMKKEMSSDSDSDVESIEMNVSVVDISSDEEKNNDDFISLKPYEVKLDKRAKGFISSKYVKPIYDVPQVKGIKKRGKKKKSKGKAAYLSNSTPSEKMLNKYFDIKKIPVQKTPDIKLSCKLCRKAFSNIDDATDHRLLGCELNKQNAKNATAVPSSQPLFWEDWSGNNK